ncbi:MAG: UDP-2,3-diacylglucosamine diphosphatase [Gammaproteobacteria bacterium]|nr:UDP-2,3-diacylglucosamine diphosphatase [Gammaproteobacteria bacterium]
MPTIGFISDLHLTEEQPERIALFLRFLEQCSPKLEQLYILGDLFEIWLGDDLYPPAYQPVLDGLKQASNSLTIFVMHGNRDFLMARQFEKLTGCKIIEEPFILNLEGKSTLLMHGDLLCTDDQDYLKMRELLRSPEWIESFLSQSSQQRIETAKGLRQKSQTAIQLKDSEIMDANTDEVIEYFERYQVEQIIHGHTHRTATHNHTLPSGEQTIRYVLDEWHDLYGQLLISDQNGLHFEKIQS